MEVINLDNDIIEKLLDIGFEKVNNKLFKKVNEKNKDLIHKLGIEKNFETAKIILDVDNNSAQIVTYLHEKKPIINEIKGQDINDLIEKILDE